MSLSYIGPKSSHESRWISYALLRDNVLHHIEKGEPSDAFACLYKITEVLGGQRVQLKASAFLAELNKAKEVLQDLPASELAISQRTQAAISFTLPLPPLSQTHLLKDGTDAGQPGPNKFPLEVFGVSLLRGEPKTLGEVFGEMLNAIIAIVQDADEDATIEVVDT